MTFNSISGIVRDESNQEVANATVALIKQSGGSIVEYTTTDSNGFYEFTTHAEADATQENWHVAVYDQDPPIFNSFSKPYVSAALNLAMGDVAGSTTFGGFKAFDGFGIINTQSVFGGEASVLEAVGGTTVKTYTDGSGTQYKAHLFENTGTDTFEVTAATPNSTVEVLIVGGGGGGCSGGGGAGGYISTVPGESSGENSQSLNPISVSEGTYSITVGSGGSGEVVTDNQNGGDGSDSSAFGLTAIGGGGGADNDVVGNDGGSGGGGGSTSTGDYSGGAGTNNQGFEGGTSQDAVAPYPAAGGGGASERGENGVPNSTPGKGGDGIESFIDGTGTYRAGGGGGGLYSASNTTSGGLGGGGDGRGDNTSGEDGIPNTGGGGGGAGRDRRGGDGGSGVVIIRYEI